MSTISASTTSTTAYKVTADTTGTIVLQTGATPTTAVTIGTDQNVTLAKGLIVGATAAPAFSAYSTSAQSISSNTATKLALQAEVFDTNSNFDSTTNYRFTPTVAGYYQFIGTFFMSVAATARTGAIIYKNGSDTSSNYGTGNSISGGQSQQVTALLYANGTTDYFEFYVVQTGATAANAVNSASLTYFQASMVRSA
jgi:hypothetical protein